MIKIVIVGGGWAGCAAAVQAAKCSMAQVVLIERTDMLLGTGLVGGIMRNNGRYTAAEEMILLGGGEFFNICDKTARHKNVDFPGHKHANLYDISITQGKVVEYLKKMGVEVVYESRITEIDMDKNKIVKIRDQNKREYMGDVFIDATGTAGPMNNCNKYGNCCAMCIMRCPSFGGRVSLASLAGVKEIHGKRADGSIGSMSGSCKIHKESLSEEIQDRLSRDGVVVIPVPEELKVDHLDIKTCQQYALAEYKDNLILLDTGHAKMMSPYFKLEYLRKINGLEFARYEDPYAGGKGNSMRFFSMVPRDNNLKVQGVDNLFCAGEKAGLLVGHTEAIVTGTLAGYNGVRYGLNTEMLELPRELAVGEIIAYTKEAMGTDEGFRHKYTFSGSIFFERMKALKLYTVDRAKIFERVSSLGLLDVFNS